MHKTQQLAKCYHKADRTQTRVMSFIDCKLTVLKDTQSFIPIISVPSSILTSVNPPK